MHVVDTDFEKAFDKVSHKFCDLITGVHLQFTTSHLDSEFANNVAGRL